MGSLPRCLEFSSLIQKVMPPFSNVFKESIATAWDSRTMLRLFVWGWIALASVIVSASAADDPLKKLGSFSAFSSIDLKRLEAGEILGEPGSQMDFPNAISTETFFAVPISAEMGTAKQVSVEIPLGKSI